MEQMGLRFFYALLAPLCYSTEKPTAVMRIPAFGRTRLFKQQRPMEGFRCIAAIDATWDAP